MTKPAPKKVEQTPETSVNTAAPAKAEAAEDTGTKPAAAAPAPAAKETSPTKAAKAPAKASPKATAKAAPVKAEAPAKTKPAKEKKVVTKKPKLVRDSFTFPETDYALIATLKQRALAGGKEVKKSEILRAGLAALAALPEKELLVALDGVVRLKPGRPNK